jgi:hypothetical protein
MPVAWSVESGRRTEIFSSFPITPQILGRLWEVATSSGSAC